MGAEGPAEAGAPTLSGELAGLLGSRGLARWWAGGGRALVTSRPRSARLLTPGCPTTESLTEFMYLNKMKNLEERSKRELDVKAHYLVQVWL